MPPTTLDRRTALQLAGAALIAAPTAAPLLARDEAPAPLLTRPIPSSGEKLPVIGFRNDDGRVRPGALQPPPPTGERAPLAAGGR